MYWIGQQCVIVVFPDHTHLLFAICDLVDDENRLVCCDFFPLITTFANAR